MTGKRVGKIVGYDFAKAHVFITPGFIFGSNGERYIRISLCAKQEVLREAAGRIRRVLHVSHFKHGSWC